MEVTLKIGIKKGAEKFLAKCNVCIEKWHSFLRTFADHQMQNLVEWSK